MYEFEELNDVVAFFCYKSCLFLSLNWLSRGISYLWLNIIGNIRITCIYQSWLLHLFHYPILPYILL